MSPTVEEHAMAKRSRVVITPRSIGEAAAAVRSVARMARISGGQIRMAYVRPIPPARVDRHDRVVADEEREMARLATVAEAWMAELAWESSGLAVERVVRFGRLAEEILVEAQVWRADLIGLTAATRPGWSHRLRAWTLRRAVSIPVVFLPVPADVDTDGRREPVVLPAFH